MRNIAQILSYEENVAGEKQLNKNILEICHHLQISLYTVEVLWPDGVEKSSQTPHPISDSIR